MLTVDFLGNIPNQPCKQGGKYLCAGFPSPLTPIPAASAKDRVGSWQHRGCHTDSSANRALQNEGTKDYNGMTVEKCVAEAQSKGFRYAGVEFHGECYYGNTISGGNSPAGSGCDTPCGGDTLQLCGGGNRMNLYENTEWKPPAPLTKFNPGVGNFKFRGCRTDNVNARTLEKRIEDWKGMTVAKCIQAAAGYKYAGVEFWG